MKKQLNCIRIMWLCLFCVLAAAANYLLTNLCVHFFKVPMYLDTVFNAAVCFAAGIIPGIISALLTAAAFGVKDGFHPFVLCSIVELLLIWQLKPAQPTEKIRFNKSKMYDMVTPFVGLFARLMLLYIVCCLAISVLGGLIDFIFYSVLQNPKHYFSAEDSFKLGLLRSGLPQLAMNIISRIPVNVVDRFIVIFGGYFVSRGIASLINNPALKG